MRFLKKTKKFLAVLLAVALIIPLVNITTDKVYAADDTVVNIPDENLKKGIYRSLDKDLSETVTVSEMESIKSLYLINVGYVYNLEGIQYCKGLDTMYLDTDGEIQNLELLGQLPRLWYLSLSSDSKQTDFNSLPVISSLGYLDIFGPLASTLEKELDLTNIGKMKNLTTLRMNNIKSNDFSPISNLSKLTRLELSANFNEIPDLSGMPKLKRVHLYSKNLQDISPLKGKVGIEELRISGIKITESNEAKYMETISSMTGLKKLDLRNVGLMDKHTSMFAPLRQLTILDLERNNISNLEFLLNQKDTLERLSLRSISTISNNDVLKQLKKLKVLQIDYTQISDFSFVSELPLLTDECVIIDSGTGIWKENSPTITNATTYDVFENNTAMIVNTVKDENGNLVAPVESENYSYDSATGNIILNLDKITDYELPIEYRFKMTAQNGTALWVKHKRTACLLGIKSQPQGTTITEGNAGELSVEAIGNELTYQWYKDGEAITGATDATLSLKNVTISNAGTYKVVVNDANGSVTSDEVKVVVNEIVVPEPEPQPQPKPEPQPQPQPTAPKTDDNTPWIFCGGLFVCAAAAMLVVVRKKRVM